MIILLAYRAYKKSVTKIGLDADFAHGMTTVGKDVRFLIGLPTYRAIQLSKAGYGHVKGMRQL